MATPFRLNATRFYCQSKRNGGVAFTLQIYRLSFNLGFWCKNTILEWKSCLSVGATYLDISLTKSAAFSCLTLNCFPNVDVAIFIFFPIPNTDCNTSFPYIETVLLKNSELINTLSAIPIFPIDRKTWREESYCYIRCIPKI